MEIPNSLVFLKEEEDGIQQEGGGGGAVLRAASLQFIQQVVEGLGEHQDLQHDAHVAHVAGVQEALGPHHPPAQGGPEVGKVDWPSLASSGVRARARALDVRLRRRGRDHPASRHITRATPRPHHESCDSGWGRAPGCAACRSSGRPGAGWRAPRPPP